MDAKRGFSDSTENLAPLAQVESPDALVVGTSQLFDGNKIRYIPMPTPDPKDPLNLPNWRKWLAVAALCFFGALALAAETIIGALVPVFALEYAGIDPKILASIDIGALSPPGSVNTNPLKLLDNLGGPPLFKVALLASVPMLVNGLSSYILVPLSIYVGRRPVLIFAGVVAWGGGLWAGFSTSLNSHLAARCFQGLGAGTVESLLPLIVQDMMFIHQRNTAIAAISASQGLIIVSLGIASPIIVARLSWRFIYYITSGAGIFAWIALIFLVPETRWMRSADELAGKEVYLLAPGETRPRVDPITYGPRTYGTEFGVLTFGLEPRAALRSVWETLKTTVFPNVLWVIAINSLLVSIQGAAGQVGSSVLIAAGWDFEKLGLAVIPIVVASPFVMIFGGYVADLISNKHAQRNGGRREPEAHLLSLILPMSAGVAGSFLFGYVGENVRTLPSIVLLVAVFLIGFGFLTANAIFSVYLVESYPQFAGPVLVNVSSIRLIIGFAFSFKATDWIQDLGFMTNFAIYGAALTGVSLLLPVMYIYGKPIRAWTSGRLEARVVKDVDDDDRDWKVEEHNRM